MGLIFRSQLNRPLTPSELDANFAYFTGSQSITGSITISGSIIPVVGDGEITSSFSLGTIDAAWKDIFVSNGSIYFISGDTGSKTTSSLSIDTSGSLNFTADLVPSAANLSLGSAKNPWKDIYVSTGSVIFVTNTGYEIAAIRAAGENEPGINPNPPGMVYIQTSTTAPFKRGSFGVGEAYAWGTGSFSQGGGNESWGQGSHAQGNKTKAFGMYAHSEGVNTVVSGAFAHAEGSATLAVGAASHAEGYYTIASGSYQLVIGQNNVPSLSQSAFIIGDGFNTLNRHNLLFASKSWFELENYPNTALNLYFKGLPVQNTSYVLSYNPTTGRVFYTSSAVGGGGGTTNPAPYDTYIQYNSGGYFGAEANFTYNYNTNTFTLTGQQQQGFTSTAAGQYSHAEGYFSDAIGIYSHAEGNNTTAQGPWSHAEGRDTNASGYYAHAEGQQTAASGPGSHAEGFSTKAVGYWAHTEGYQTRADGFYAHAEGITTSASGYASHAEGFSTTAYGPYSHAEGNTTIASGSYQTVVGQFNKALPSQSSFIVGDGVDANTRHNVLFASKSWFEVSASNTFLQGLPTTPQSQVLIYNSSSGQVFYTASSAFGGTTYNNSYSGSITQSISIYTSSVYNVYTSSNVINNNINTSSYIYNYYYSSSVINSGSGGCCPPAPPEEGIQYNSGSEFAASSYFLYHYVSQSL